MLAFMTTDNEPIAINPAHVATITATSKDTMTIAFAVPEMENVEVRCPQIVEDLTKEAKESTKPDSGERKTPGSFGDILAGADVGGIDSGLTGLLLQLALSRPPKR